MRKWFVMLLSVLSVVTLAACSAAPTQGNVAVAQEPEETVPVVTRGDQNTVLAEGTVEPALWRNLAFDMPGEVVEVRVETGDRVEAGEVLARLDTRALSLSLQSAEQDVKTQRAALDQLLKGASDNVIARADKSVADQVEQARVGLQAKQLQLRKARAQDPAEDVAAAQARVSRLQGTLAQARAQDPTPNVTVAQVALERVRIALSDTQNEYNKAMDRPWEDQALRDEWTKRLEQVQLDYRATQAQLESTQNALNAHQAGLNVIAAQIEEAEVQLGQAIRAQEIYTLTLQMMEAEVKATELNLEALRTTDNPFRDRASDEEIAQMEAQLHKTELAVESLTVRMEDAELTAPFEGTVVDVYIEVGDQVSPAQAVVVLATIDALEVRTTDLTELEVVQVAVGQPVKVRVDALPGRTFAGRVREVSLQGQDYRGDVVYPVTVSLTDSDASQILRWGMTAAVEIRTP